MIEQVEELTKPGYMLLTYIYYVFIIFRITSMKDDLMNSMKSAHLALEEYLGNKQ